MKIFAKVRPNAKENKIEKINDSEFALWVKEAAKEGKANKAAITMLSEFFDIPKSRIAIIAGHKSRNKIISLDWK